MKKVKDHYFYKAKKAGFAARSAFKLQEIDQKHALFKKKDCVLDLGCAPGSWLQYACQKVGLEGVVVGIDCQPVTLQFPKNVTILEKNIDDYQAEAKYFQYFDTILSDMAPPTSGIRAVDAQKSYHLCGQALLLAEQYLKPQGNLLVKAFQGAGFEEVRQAFQKKFQKVKLCKPKSSRPESVEIFLLGLQKHSSFKPPQ